MTSVSRSFLADRIRERSGMELGPYPVTGRFVEQDELKLMIAPQQIGKALCYVKVCWKIAGIGQDHASFRS